MTPQNKIKKKMASWQTFLQRLSVSVAGSKNHERNLPAIFSYQVLFLFKKYICDILNQTHVHTQTHFKTHACAHTYTKTHFLKSFHLKKGRKVTKTQGVTECGR